jgi:hypothetical protein
MIGTKLTEIREQQFPLESEIQKLTEANLYRAIVFEIGHGLEQDD